MHKFIGDGICDDVSNIPECGFDEEDCCLPDVALACDKCTCFVHEYAYPSSTAGYELQSKWLI